MSARAIELLDRPSSKKVMVVAHADDEVLWGGGLILGFPGNWTVICCSTPRRDPERIELFYHACKTLGAKGVSIPILETNALENEDLDHLDRIPDLSGYDVIVTHGAGGEYGCHHHVQLHKLLASQYLDQEMVFFAYGAKNEDFGLEVQLPIEMVETKLQALKCYSNWFMRGGRRICTWIELYEKFYGERESLQFERHLFRE